MPRMKTYRGNWINLDKMPFNYYQADNMDLVSEIDIYDIAHALAYQNRFMGHTSMPYSVAQHSILVSKQVWGPHALWGLLHDAAEAYTGDIARPIKQFMPSYTYLERALMNQIARTFGLPTREMPVPVSEADNRMCVTEMQSPLVYNQKGVTPLGAEHVRPYQMKIRPYKTPQEAERRFLKRFFQLYKD